MISGDMTVAQLLDEHPELVEVLARYHPHFEQLRNRRPRRLMGRRLTVAEAAGMAGVPAHELLTALRCAVTGPPQRETPHLRAPYLALSPERRETAEKRGAGPPQALGKVPEGRRVHLDVREDIRAGREPFARIMSAVKMLAGDQVLALRAPFEPVPLYDVLGLRGFAHWTERRAADDWLVWFYPDAELRVEPAPPFARPAPRHAVLDVRGLEPPDPMLRVLEAVDRLGPGTELEVRHDRRPILLYPQLDARGFSHETDEPEPGLVRIVIRRAGA